MAALMDIGREETGRSTLRPYDVMWWQRRAIVRDAHQRAIERQRERIKKMGVTEKQLSILKMGESGQPFRLTQSQSGVKSSALIEMGLLVRLAQGLYQITEAGKIAVTLPPDEVVDRNDKRATRIKELVARIKTLEAALNDTGRSVLPTSPDTSPALAVIGDAELNRIIEQKDGQIEALRRCLNEMEVKMVQLEKAAGGNGHLAEQILDELCDLIPEVENYRQARENAVKAIHHLKGRR